MRSKQMLVRCGFLAVVVMSTCVSAAPSPGRLLPGLASGLAGLEVTQVYQVATPQLDGYTFDWYDCVWLWLWCPTPGAVMRYTVDGTNPQYDSPVYHGLLIVRGTGIVKVRAFKDGMYPSNILVIYIYRS